MGGNKQSYKTGEGYFDVWEGSAVNIRSSFVTIPSPGNQADLKEKDTVITTSGWEE
jgi:hypothetical protein